MQWEYKTIKIGIHASRFWLSGGKFDVIEFNKILNELGREHWELVSAFDARAADNDMNEQVVAVFKRPFGEYKDSAIPGGLSQKVKALADAPAQKIEAIKLHREQTGLGLSEAKDAVEAYLAGRG